MTGRRRWPPANACWTRARRASASPSTRPSTLPAPSARRSPAGLPRSGASSKPCCRRAPGVGVLAFTGGDGRVAAPGYLADAVAADEDRLDLERARDSLAAAARQAVSARPGIAAWLLEEPEMGPFAADIRAATGRPVYDRTRFLAWFHASLAPRVFPR